DEEKALNNLLDAFESVFSLNDIASAYCEAGRNSDLAGLILCEMQGIPSLVSTDQSNNKSSCQANGDLRSPKQKARPVSKGTVSSMLGKGYMKSVPLANGEKLESNSQNEDLMYKDMEDFIFKMLGKEFRLERDVIREIVVDTTCKRYGTMDNVLILEDLKFAVDAFAKGDQDQANKLLEQ
ncbi:hypothetical protein Goshw_006304, partial [Gossypium schwendimanii]|nr:hypothetical protein [Gossypium schwendimanii]